MAKYRYKIQNDEKARIVARLAKEKIAYWELGQALGCHENTVARMLRNPNPDTFTRIMSAIDEIAASQE